MRRVLPIFIIYIIGLSLVSATYTWTGTVQEGAIQVNDLTLNITKTLSNTTVVLILNNSQLIDILRVNETKNIANISFSLIDDNGTLHLSISSEKFFTVVPYTAEKPEEPEKTETDKWSFTWRGIILANETLYLDNNMSLHLLEGPLLEIDAAGEKHYLDKGSATVGGVYIELTPMLHSAELFIASNSRLGVTYEPIVVEKVVNNTIIVNQTNETALKELEALKAELKEKNETIANLTAQIGKLKKENTNLRQEIEKLQSELNQAQSANKDFNSLQSKLLNLTKENRKLKEELANITTKYNQLKAKADFLSQQNEEYRQIIQQVMNEQSSEAKQSYIEKAKNERLIGSVLLKGLTASLVVVGLVGYGLYRAKRRHEFAGL